MERKSYWIKIKKRIFRSLATPTSSAFAILTSYCHFPISLTGLFILASTGKPLCHLFDFLIYFDSFASRNLKLKYRRGKTGKVMLRKNPQSW